MGSMKIIVHAYSTPLLYGQYSPFYNENPTRDNKTISKELAS